MSLGMLHDSVVFSGSRYVLLIFSLIRNFIVAKYLGPSDYGLWVVIGLLLTYGDQIHLGLRHAGDKEIPYYRGQGRTDESKRIADSILGGVLWLAGIAFLCLTVYSLVFTSSEESLLRYGILIAAFIIVTDQVNRFYLVILRTRHEFLLSSKVESGFELLRTILVSGLAVAFHFYGAIIGLFIASLATAVYFLVHYRNEFRPRCRFSSLKSLLAIGLPLSTTGLLYILTLNLDRLIGAFAFSKENLGIYGMASLLAQVPVTSSQGISSVVFPRISEQFGETRNLAQLKPLFASAMTGAAFVAPLLVASIFLVGQFLILWLLPTYHRSIHLLFLLSFGIYFLCLVPIPAALLIASGRNILYLRSEISTLLIVLAAYGIIFLTQPLTLPLLAVITSISFLLLSTFLFIQAYRTLGTRRRDRLREIAKFYLPSLYAATALTFIYSMIPSDTQLEFQGFITQTVASLALFCVLYSPMVYLLNRNTGVVTRIIRSVTAKEGKIR